MKPISIVRKSLSTAPSPVWLLVLLAITGCDTRREYLTVTESRNSEIGKNYAALSMRKTFDLGKLRKDESNNIRTITIENIGSAELIVGNFSSSCGCALLPSMELLSVPPGETGTIAIALQASIPGAHNAVVRFETNDPRQPFVDIAIQWDVESIISFEQEGWDAGVFGKDGPVIARLLVSSFHEDITSIEETLLAKFDPPIHGLECHLGEAALTVVGEVKSPHVTDSIQGNILIIFRDSEELALVLPFRAKLQGDVEIWPMDCDVELNENNRPFIRFIVSNLPTTDDLSFQDQERRKVEFFAEPTGSNEWLVKRMLHDEPTSKRISATVGDFEALRGYAILADWKALNP